MKTEGKHKIGIIGRVADSVEMYDGQTVTTRIIRDELENRLNTSVYCVDTYDYKHHAFRCLLRSFVCLFRCEHIFILLSNNGRRFFLPFLYFANKLFHRRIYHRMIGGLFGKNVKQHPRWVTYLNSFVVNLAEGRSQVEALRIAGVRNVVETHTFRNAQIVSADAFPAYSSPPFRFCTFCRVTKAKGISDALQAVTRINSAHDAYAKLDIYGPLDEEYRNEFELLLAQSNGAAQYKGCVPPETSVETLKGYFMHLFPTTWKGEGTPGTLVDCFAAGLPTIATDWNYNAEILREGEIGFCYDWHHPERLEEKMLYCMEHPEQIANMRYACIKEAEKYQPDASMQQIFGFMGLNF
ncbi:MAG: glycosyltransferase [Oscillospiraceae bacterium]|nr:glycosyltransferase [Oscillospiraceae bacterium]